MVTRERQRSPLTIEVQTTLIEVFCIDLRVHFYFIPEELVSRENFD